MKEKPELADLVQPKIGELLQSFDHLERTTKEKGERLFDANRETLMHQTCDDIDSWMNDLEKQIESDDTGSDLASVNILMQKQQVSLLKSSRRQWWISECIFVIRDLRFTDDRDSNGGQSEASVRLGVAS